jgi:ATP phosphoribosyltransferase regulatory subunit
MTTEAASPTDRLIGLFEREGFLRVEPPVLQPAELFVDLSGEDIRRRMFVTQDAAGREFCLRPEYTIPVCRHHLAQTGTATPAAYSYLGPVFRLRANEAGEFLQAGIESIGRLDAPAADAEILALALEGLEALGAGAVTVRLGDMGLLDAVLDAPAVPPAAKRRLVRSIVSGESIDPAPDDRARGCRNMRGCSPRSRARRRRPPRAFVEDILSIAGISRVGGRSAADIAERFLARAANRSGALAPSSTRSWRAISPSPAIPTRPRRRWRRSPARPRSPSTRRADDSRTAPVLWRRAGSTSLARLRRSFARNLDYYTGFIFEIGDPRRADQKPVVGGGRYDRLLQHLGGAAPTPAVGCSIWLDRLGVGSAA